MYQLLLSVQKPDINDHKATPEYDNIVDIWAGLATENKDIRQIAQGCMLLPLNKGLKYVVAALSPMKDLTYTYAILTEDIQWHEGTNVFALT
uniref:Uncharacterized protein n=1 Tax=viral metagenome TaxID=1070528 RepID=A0A6M3XUC5_9ZZZZ